MDESQREFRKTLLTGTKVAAVLGRGTYRTGYDVYAQTKGLVPDVEQTPAMLRGTILERGILDYYELTHNVKLARDAGTIVHPHEDWIGASPDGFYEDEDGALVIVDAKTARQRRTWGEPGTDDIPIDYALQLQWYALVLGAHFDKPVSALHVITYFPMNDEIGVYHISPDVELQQNLVLRCRKWWFRHIVANVPPELDHGRAAELMVQQERTGDTLVAADDMSIEDIESLIKVKEEVKTLLKQKKELETKIKAAIGSELGIMGSGRKATWKEQKGRESWDVKQLEVDHPELAEKYKKQGKTYRVLRVG